MSQRSGLHRLALMTDVNSGSGVRLDRAAQLRPA